MTSIHKLHLHFRYFLMTVSFLWAFMLLGQDVAACAIVHDKAFTEAANATEQVTSENSHGLLLFQGDQFLAENATLSFSNFSLQQAIVPVRTHYFGLPTDEAIPPYAARAPGLNSFSQFFLTSITPHAP